MGGEVPLVAVTSRELQKIYRVNPLIYSPQKLNRRQSCILQAYIAHA